MSLFRTLMTQSRGGGQAPCSKYGATVDTFLGDVDSTGELLAPTAQTDLVFDGVTDLAMVALYHRFYENPTIKTVSFPDLVQISGAQALHQCFYGVQTNTINFPVLETISGNSCFGYTFQNNDSIQSIEFPSLISISGLNTFYSTFYRNKNLTSCSFPVLEELTGSGAFNGCFEYCYALTSVQFPKLRKIGADNTTSYNSSHFSNAFSSCSNLTSLEFPELTAIYCSNQGYTDGTFYGNGTIQKLYFPKLSVIDKSPAYASPYANSHKNIFYSCSKLTEIHFGAANQAAIEATEGYPTLWGRGAGNATVYFDL